MKILLHHKWSPSPNLGEELKPKAQGRNKLPKAMKLAAAW